MGDRRTNILPLMLEPSLVTGPANPVLPLQEVKAHLRVDAEDEDALLLGYILAAEQYLDGWNGLLGKAMITQTWRADYDKFPGWRRVDLPIGPVQSVTVNYSDADNTEQTLAASKYAVLEDVKGPFLWLDEGEDSWPDTFDREDAVRISIVAGYGDDPSDVPEPVRLAMMHMVAQWYAYREPMVVGQGFAALPHAAEVLLKSHARPQF